MSIKALQRRAREARQWLALRALPLWIENGLIGSQFAARLSMNHKPMEDDEVGSEDDQRALAALFALAPRIGFSSDRIDLDRLDGPGEISGEAGDGRNLSGTCAALRSALIDLSAAESDSAAQSAARTAADIFDTLMDDFLTPEGGWIEGYSAEGFPVSDEIPARLAAPLAAALSPLLGLIEA